MSKRVTLTGREIEIIVKSITYVIGQTPRTTIIERAGQQVLQDIIGKLRLATITQDTKGGTDDTL